MNTKELAQLLHGREYTEEITEEEEKQAKENNLVVVFGASDDLIEFFGAINDEIGCYNGGKVFLDEYGIIQNLCEEDDCPYFKEVLETSKLIEAVWCGDDDYSWSYETDIPHETFDVMEYDEEYCRGIVFNMNDLLMEPA